MVHFTRYGAAKIENDRYQIPKWNPSVCFLATDLAARELMYLNWDYHSLISYQPRVGFISSKNGRTARMTMLRATAFYSVTMKKERLPILQRMLKIEKLQPCQTSYSSDGLLFFISGGQTNKISKGDIAGLFLKQETWRRIQLGSSNSKTDLCFCRGWKKLPSR